MTTRCPDCGATNSRSADWCGQCYGSLTMATGQQHEPAAAASTAGGHEDPQPPQPEVEGFRRRGDAVEWECPACGEWSRVEDLQCGKCATPLSARWERTPAGDGMVATRSFDEPWIAALALSAVVPGAGHIGVRRYRSGLARALLFAAWLVGGVGLVVAVGAPTGAPLLLGAGVLWVASLVDVAALRAGRREVLGGRRLWGLVVIVLALWAVSVLGAVT